MQGTGNLFSKIYAIDNLRLAYKNAKKGKGWYKEVKEIEKDLDRYLNELRESLINHTYHTSPYEIFTRIEGQKEREIYKLAGSLKSMSRPLMRIWMVALMGGRLLSKLSMIRMSISR